MSASTFVCFLRKAEDPDHVANVEAVKALKSAKVRVLPIELQEYFGVQNVPDVNGSEFLETIYTKLDFINLQLPFIQKVTLPNYGNVLEIDLNKLPNSGVTLEIDLENLPIDTKTVIIKNG